MFLNLLPSMITKFCFLLLRVNQNGNFPKPLSADEEKVCFEKAITGDKVARNRLIEHNLRLVAHIVKKYQSSGTNQDDLMSVGTIGLIKAIDTYNPVNGTKFATYASKCLQNEILMYFRTQKKLSGEVSINETIETDKDGNSLSYLDIIKTEDTIADDIDRKIKIEMLTDIINHKLTQRERQIIIMRYGLNGGNEIRQREIAEKLNISRSYVSRIEKASLEKIKQYFQNMR